MGISLAQLDPWQKVLLVYLAIGYCTQLPGVAFGHHLFLPHFRHLQRSSSLARFAAAIAWLALTALLWPRPFLRAGLNMLAIELILLGILGSVAMLTVADSIAWAVVVVASMTIGSLLLARRRGLRG